MYDELVKSRDRVLVLCGKLEADSAERKPEGGAWSVSEVVEHLAITERMATVSVKRALSQPEADPAVIESTQALDAVIQGRIAQRTTRVAAPDIAQPNGRFGVWPGALESLLEMRDRSLELAKSDPQELNTRVFPHPFLGPMSLRQWLEFIAAHTERHCAQIEELLGKSR